MQEYTSPGEVQISPDENLTASLWKAAEQHPDRPIVAVRVGDGFVNWTTRQFVEQVKGVAKGLMASGVEKGDKVCIHAATCVEWTILDYAIWAAGGVTVPIYETSSAEQIDWIVTDSGAKILVTQDAELKAVVDEVAANLPGLEHVLVIADGALETLKQQGEQISDEDLETRSAAAVGDDVATLVYTSGTTGRPKGCVITHYSFIWDAEQAAKALPEILKPGGTTLFFLPLAHIFARVIQTSSIRHGVVLGYASGIPQLVEELGIFKPTFLVAVPRIFEKVFNGARQKAVDDGKGKIFDKAAQVAEDFSRQSEAGKPAFFTKLLHGIFDKLVYSKLRAVMGGNVAYAVSGGAALGERLSHFYNGIGVTILEGYGLTETTAGHCIGRVSASQIGTVGQPLPGASVRIAPDGEILLKGGNIFRGYNNNPEATAEVKTEDGWFHSGDLGEIVGNGFVKITGRKKELIVTAGGKNVAPAVLEDRMRSHALVSQSMVIGDGQPFIAALIAIDAESFPTWAAANGKEGKSVAELTDDPDLKAEIQHAIDEANQAVSKAESIRTFRILPEDFEVGVELSQKMSVKRHVVAEKYKDVIDDIYAGVSR
jgi:long-chain acyl-CoA synthetase